MRSETPGTSISSSPVTNIDPQGFWLLVDDSEYFVPFEDYPVFARATLDQIFNVERLSPGQLHWPALDADVEIEALESPERFPLSWG